MAPKDGQQKGFGVGIKISDFLNRPLITALVMGMASGLPLSITVTLMQAWAKEADVSLTQIGLMSLVGLPYTLKFVWAPLFDRFALPMFGRRRGWMILMQFFLMLSIWGMGFCNPAGGQTALILFIVAAFFVAFFSASQDIVIDAFRREDLKNEQLGLGSSYYIYGYRLGLLLVGGGGMILADLFDWLYVFLLLGLLILPAMLVTLWVPEPQVVEEGPRNFRDSVVGPFKDYFSREHAWLILWFILLYKVGDNLAAAMATPFYLDLGFSKTEIGAVVKLFGFWSILLGNFVGGLFILRMGIKKSLWLFGLIQMASTAGFAALALVGAEIPALAFVVSFENLASGMGTAAFVAFMASLTNKKFTATQYALLTSLMGVPRVILSSSTGLLAAEMGWFWFFTFCTAVAIPGMILLATFAPLRKRTDHPEPEVVIS